MGILERIADIEKEMSRTQKNKATESHLGTLKAKLAKLKRELLEPAKGGGSSEERGFEVNRYGHGRVALIGFPSVGKSTLLSELTSTESEAASYEFTTLTCIPGVIHYNDAKIQLLDLPGIIEGASEGKGRGRQVIAVAKSSDLILMVLDAMKSEAANTTYAHKQILTRELEAVGLRLNQTPPRIYVKKSVTPVPRGSALSSIGIDREIRHRNESAEECHPGARAGMLFRENCISTGCYSPQ